jgi:hypothetical protein
MTERHRILLDLIRRQEQFKLRVRRPLDPKVMKYIEEGKPFVAIDDDGLLCLLCGKHLLVAGSHFSVRHGIPRAMNHHERAMLYGLVQGARLISLPLQERLREAQLARVSTLFSLVSFMKSRQQTEFRIRGKAVAPMSEKQLMTWRKGSAAGRAGRNRYSAEKHRAAMRTIACSECRIPISFVQWTNRKYCSRHCSSIAGNRKRWAALSAEERKIFGQKLTSFRRVAHSTDFTQLIRA